MSAISNESQIRYLLQWFKEWSEFQRTDFLPILAENYAYGAYMNGIVNNIGNMNFRDKPMTLFECRVKLFKEWFIQWSLEQKEHFLKKIGEIDPTFMEKLQVEIQKRPELNNESNTNANELP